MNATPGRRVYLALAAFVVAARSAGAADVEVAPFLGAQFGSSFASTVSGRTYSLGTGLDYGATLDVAIDPSWWVEFLYSRQKTDLSGGSGVPPFDIKVERYMAGIQEVKEVGRSRAFGVFLLGATRFAPGLSGFGSDTRFTLGLSLGLKTPPSRRIGFRAEARGFFVVVESGGGALCSNGNCLFSYRASGLWQGDVSAAVVFAF
jgi:hypothetical protein